jgi:hypothetical protein
VGWYDLKGFEMSGTAREAERAQELRRKAANGDKAAQAALQQGENDPDGTKAQPHDVGREESPNSAKPGTQED